MNTDPIEVQCPYCGEGISVEVEPISKPQNYIEDCSVCCRPIEFNVVMGEEGLEVSVSRSDS